MQQDSLQALKYSLSAAAILLILAMFMGVPAMPACPVKSAIGIPCLSCGSTRALQALTEANLLAVLRWNPLVGLLPFFLPIALALFFSPRCRTFLNRSKQQLNRHLPGLLLVHYLWLLVSGV